MKTIIFEKDNELIVLVSNNKTSLQQVDLLILLNEQLLISFFSFFLIFNQMEDRMERERKVWNEHKELLIAGERAKYEEEKTRLLKDLQDQLKIEQERSQRLEKKLYEVQMVRKLKKKSSFLFNFLD